MDRQSRTGKRSSGQTLAETIGGLVVLIPIVLLLVDVGTIMAANLTNVDLCKRACRTASSVLDNNGKADGKTAFDAANAIKEKFATSSTIRKPEIAYFDWEPNPNTPPPPGPFKFGTKPSEAPDPMPGEVTVITTMEIAPPIPFPGMPPTFQAKAQSIQPIVGLPPVVPGP